MKNFFAKSQRATLAMLVAAVALNPVPVAKADTARDDEILSAAVLGVFGSGVADALVGLGLGVGSDIGNMFNRGFTPRAGMMPDISTNTTDVDIVKSQKRATWQWKPYIRDTPKQRVQPVNEDRKSPPKEKGKAPEDGVSSYEAAAVLGTYGLGNTGSHLVEGDSVKNAFTSYYVSWWDRRHLTKREWKWGAGWTRPGVLVGKIKGADAILRELPTRINGTLLVGVPSKDGATGGQWYVHSGNENAVSTKSGRDWRDDAGQVFAPYNGVLSPETESQGSKNAKFLGNETNIALGWAGAHEIHDASQTSKINAVRAHQKALDDISNAARDNYLAGLKSGYALLFSLEKRLIDNALPISQADSVYYPQFSQSARNTITQWTNERVRLNNLYSDWQNKEAAAAAAFETANDYADSAGNWAEVEQNRLSVAAEEAGTLADTARKSLYEELQISTLINTLNKAGAAYAEERWKLAETTRKNKDAEIDKLSKSITDYEKQIKALDDKNKKLASTDPVFIANAAEIARLNGLMNADIQTRNYKRDTELPPLKVDEENWKAKYNNEVKNDNCAFRKGICDTWNAVRIDVKTLQTADTTANNNANDYAGALEAAQQDKGVVVSTTNSSVSVYSTSAKDTLKQLETFSASMDKSSLVNRGNTALIAGDYGKVNSSNMPQLILLASNTPPMGPWQSAEAEAAAMASWQAGPNNIAAKYSPIPVSGTSTFAAVSAFRNLAIWNSATIDYVAETKLVPISLTGELESNTLATPIPTSLGFGFDPKANGVVYFKGEPVSASVEQKTPTGIKAEDGLKKMEDAYKAAVQKIANIDLNGQYFRVGANIIPVKVESSAGSGFVTGTLPVIINNKTDEDIYIETRPYTNGVKPLTRGLVLPTGTVFYFTAANGFYVFPDDAITRAIPQAKAILQKGN